MAHLIVMADTFPENHERFVKWMQKRALQYPAVYNDHTLNIKPREIRIYDIVHPESLQDEILSDFKALEDRAHTRHFDFIVNGLKKAQKLPIIKKLFEHLRLVDMDKVNARPIEELQPFQVDGETWWVYAKVIGIVDDSHHAEGKYEMI